MAENDDMKGKRMPKSVSKAELRLKKRSRTELDSPTLENATTNAIVNESRELINEDKKLGHENSIMGENSMASNTSVATESPIADSSYGIKEIFIGRESFGVGR
ncbi:hypothetical protein GQX74_015320, partial [Glossina fuscipes]